MALSIIKNPLILSPAYNPIQFDLDETSYWEKTNYYTLVWNDSRTILDDKQFRKSNVYNSRYFSISIETTLQDYLIHGEPLKVKTNLNYTGIGWCKSYYGAVDTETGPSELMRNSFVFNGSFDRNDWIDLTITELVPNASTASNGRFLTKFDNRSVKFTSIGTTSVFNGSLESANDYLNNTEYLYTDYHNISFRNNNSLGQFTNNFTTVVDDNYGIRTLRLFNFLGPKAQHEFVAGDVIQYTTNPSSSTEAFYGTSLNGIYTVTSVSKAFFDFAAPNGWVNYIDIRVDDSVPTTFDISGGTNTSAPDNGTVTLIEREWAVYNKYYESGRYLPMSFIGDTGVNSLALYPHNKKLTFPSFPNTIRKSNGKRYFACIGVTVDGNPASKLFIREDISNYEVGDQIINHCDGNPVTTGSIIFNSRWTILEVGTLLGVNTITIDCDFANVNSSSVQGIVWNIQKDGLVKKTRRIVPAIMDSFFLNIAFKIKARDILGLPDRFVVTLENGGPTFSVPNDMLIEFVDYSMMTSPDAYVTIATRSNINSLPDLTTDEKNTLLAGATFSVDICIHHQIVDNQGYVPLFGYDGSLNDPFYNSPINSDLNNYEIELEKILTCDTKQSQSPNGILKFDMNKKCTKYEDTHITWLNNYGSFDSATFDWMKKHSREYIRDTYRKTAGRKTSDSYVYSKSDKELTDYRVTTDTIGTLDSDWIKEGEYNRLLEILDSPVVYMWMGDYYLPIVIEIDDIEEKTLLNDKLFNLKLEYRITYNQKSIRI